MLIPFKLRKLPLYVFDGDGQFPKTRIKGRDRRRLRKRQIKQYIKESQYE